MKKDNRSKKFELLARHIEMFKEAFAGYIEYYKSHNIPKKDTERHNQAGEITYGDAAVYGNADADGDEFNNLPFEEIICNYYETVISALKKLTKYDKKHLAVLIETYGELWKSAPKLKNKDYLSPYLSDLCKFLYETGEAGALTFFYNLLIYCREIPFLSLHEKQENQLADLYTQNGGKDPFDGFRKERRERIIGGFDEALFDKAYGKFFFILSGWNERVEGYYTKDEIFFMNGLFILDELINYVYLEETGRGGENKTFIKAAEPKGCGNVYRYAYDDAVKEKISYFYKKALRYFNRAIHYNTNNPRYYYEYARCLKNSGKSEEAEIFFKKAFDLNA